MYYGRHFHGNQIQLSGKIRIGGLIPKAGYLIDEETANQIESGVGFRDVSSTNGEDEVVREIPRMYDPDTLADSTYDDVDIPPATTTQTTPASDFYGNDITFQRNNLST